MDEGGWAVEGRQPLGELSLDTLDRRYRGVNDAIAPTRPALEWERIVPLARGELVEPIVELCERQADGVRNLIGVVEGEWVVRREHRAEVGAAPGFNLSVSRQTLQP